jgi:hypothetical protein
MMCLLNALYSDHRMLAFTAAQPDPQGPSQSPQAAVIGKPAANPTSAP